MTGTIKRIVPDKPFGFIVVDGAAPGDKDVFFHESSVTGGTFAELKEGDKVSFEVEPGEGGKGPKAVGVSKA
jgi:cold shock protein